MSRTKPPKQSTRKLLDEYRLGEVIGQGAFGVVHACSKADGSGKGEKLCVKMIDRVESPLAAIQRETEMLQQLDHPNVVKLREVYWEACFVCVVMDRFMGGDLIAGMQAHWKSIGKIPMATIGCLCKQILASIHYLHGKSIVHRDIKGDNYLMDTESITDTACRVVVADFGTAKKLEEGARMSGACGTKAYWSPEFFAKNYGIKVDVWAVGVLVYGLAHSRFPFKGERDACAKDPKLSADLPKEFVDLIKKLLEKQEEKRITAAEAVAHPWVVAAHMAMEVAPHTSVPLDDEETKEMKEGFREGGANAAIAERRQELVEQIQLNHAMERHMTRHSFHRLLTDHMFREEFTIEAGGSVVRYKWQKDLDCLPENTSKKSPGAFNAPLAQSNAGDVDAMQEVVALMLKDHGVDVGCFGKSHASKTLAEFAAEVQSGSSRLMLDAREHKKIVRVVDVVLLRLSIETGSGEYKYLIEESEQYKDKRQGHSNRLPAMKKEPHLNTRQVAEKLLKERLNIKAQVELDMDRLEFFEEEEESSSYPGVQTTYHKEIVEGRFVSRDSNAMNILKGRLNGWTYEDSAGVTRSFVWLMEQECDARGVRLKSPAQVGGLTHFVRAPVGFNEEELREHLESHDVDVSKFGTDGAKSLKQFSEELLRGESSLVELPTDGTESGGTVDRKSKLVRIVDIVCILLFRKDNGYVLVEALASGDVRPPAAKRRPDENQHLAAKRHLKKHFRIDENRVFFRIDGVNYHEEEKESASYPGLKTVYRKCFLSADLTRSSDVLQDAIETTSESSDALQPAGMLGVSCWQSMVEHCCSLFSGKSRRRDDDRNESIELRGR